MGAFKDGGHFTQVYLFCIYFRLKRPCRLSDFSFEAKLLVGSEVSQCLYAFALSLTFFAQNGFQLEV